MFRFEFWPTEYRSITQSFGVHPEFYGRFGLPGHEGIDFQAPEGSRLFAVSGGQVIQVERREGDARLNPYGLHLTVEHEEGYLTIYAHLSEILVRQGQRIEAGHTLGRSGNTGNSRGAHLHLTLKKLGTSQPPWPNNIIDPTPFVLPLLGFSEPAGPYTEGWAYTAAITIHGTLAQANAGGISLRSRATQNSRRIAIVPEGSMMRVNGTPRNGYTPVLVPAAAIGRSAPPTAPPPPDLPPTISTVDGWAWSSYVTVMDSQGIVGEYGINLRAAPARNGANIGVVGGGTVIEIMGEQVGEYLPVRAPRNTFLGDVNLPASAPDFSSGVSFAGPGDTFLGWAWSAYLENMGSQATVGQYGVNLRARPDRTGEKIGVVKGYAVLTIAGETRGEYTPVVAHYEDMLDITNEDADVEQPLPGGGAPAPAPPPPAPMADSTPGWAFSSALEARGSTGIAGPYGINLRDAPRRNGKNIGFVPAGAQLLITGTRTGEYTPVRVDDNVLQRPFGTAAPAAPTPPPSESSGPAAPPPVNPTPPILGQARIGLHASADPDISTLEKMEFAAMRPSIIKVLSHHSANDIAQLANAHPQATWIVRAFLDFGGRRITPQQFHQFTRDDVRRALDQLRGQDVVIELHNEPNLTMEGLGESWSDGHAFNAWWLELLFLYRGMMPGERFIFPGLSPGHGIDRVRHEHTAFIEACRPSINAADGLGTHIYWSASYAMETALSVLDDYIRRFPDKPVWVTEASNNQPGPTPVERADQYLRFWQALQRRPTVQGVTYFVASSRFAFPDEVWIKDGKRLGIAQRIGRR